MYLEVVDILQIRSLYSSLHLSQPVLAQIAIIGIFIDNLSYFFNSEYH